MSWYYCKAGPEEEWFLYRSNWFKITKCHKAVFESWRPVLTQNLTLMEASQILDELLGILDKCQPVRSTDWIVWGLSKCSYWCSSVTSSQVFLVEVLQVSFGPTSKQECHFSALLWTADCFSWCLGLGRPFSKKLLWLNVQLGMSVLQMSWCKLHWWLSNKWPKASLNFSVQNGIVISFNFWMLKGIALGPGTSWNQSSDSLLTRVLELICNPACSQGWCFPLRSCFSYIAWDINRQLWDLQTNAGLHYGCWCCIQKFSCQRRVGNVYQNGMCKTSFGKDLSQSCWERWKTGSRDNWRVGGETNLQLNGCILRLLFTYFSFVLCVQYFLELKESEAACRLFSKQHLSNEDEALG